MTRTKTRKTKMSEIEYRFIPLADDFTLRAIAAADGKPAKLAGYAAVFGSTSEDLGGFREIIAPGAFRESIDSGDDIRALFAHDPNMLLGRTSNKTLRLSEDDKGLRFEMDVPDTSYARDMMALVNRGDIRGMSFGFRTAKDGDSWAKSGGSLIRTLKNVKLGEVSVVAQPAYRATELSVRVDPAWIAKAKDMARPAALIERQNWYRKLIVNSL